MAGMSPPSPYLAAALSACEQVTTALLRAQDDATDRETLSAINRAASSVQAAEAEVMGLLLGPPAPIP